MNSTDIREVIESLFVKAVKDNGLKTGDVAPDQAFKLMVIEKELLILINDFIDNNKQG